MLNYIVRRILQAIPMLFLLSILLFALVNIAPGGPLAGHGRSRRIRPEKAEILKRQFGLDKPLPMQYLIWLIGNDWMKVDADGDGVAESYGERRGILRGDFGFSYRNREPVLDEIGKPIVNQDAIGSTVEIDPSLVIDDEEEGEEPLAEHPVASALANFFADALGLDYDTIMDHHESGIGFGVIAQACWMSYALEGDVTLLDAILNAKKSGDFSAIMLSEDGETARNWGQFKKAVLKSGNEKVQKNLANLGAIMSGRAEPPGGTDGGDEGELGATSTEGKVKGKKDQAGGKPDAPPGQVKNKDKGQGGGKNK